MNKLSEHIDRMSRRAALIIVGILLILFSSPATAQTYSFSVDSLNMQVFILEDSSVRIVYDIQFSNSQFGDPIDIIDIGTPNENYDINNMRASIGGTSLTDIRVSEYVTPGVEIHLRNKAIPSGQTDIFHFEFTMPEMIFSDVTNRDLASFQITPTWFEGGFIQGTTNLQIAIHMLEGVNPDEVLYQKEPFTTKATFQNHTVVAWEFPETQLTRAHIVGVSFPTRGLTNITRMNVISLAVFWFENNTNLRVIAGIVFLILFAILFLRFTGGTGFTLWLILSGLLVWMFITSPGLHLFGFIPLIIGVIINENKLRKRKKNYLPAIAQVEGGGIKRGLTAPEAAALLELPINKVLTLIIFGILKKGVIKQVKDTPLAVEVDEAFLASKRGKTLKERAAFRRQVAQQKGIVIHNYEHRFLDILEKSPGKPVHTIDLGSPMQWFLKNLANRMKGFDISDTQDYYRKIVDRAWKYAESIGEIPKREKVLDKHMEWILMHEDHPTVFHTPRHVYAPIWIRRTYPTSGGVLGKSTGGVRIGGGKSGSSGPGFGDVAAGFAGWAENTMGSMASALLPGSIKMDAGKGGLIDLSGVDKATGDFFDALASSSGGSGGGGGGGGCACACAGCACACACAGGGR